MHPWYHFGKNWMIGQLALTYINTNSEDQHIQLLNGSVEEKIKASKTFLNNLEELK